MTLQGALDVWARLRNVPTYEALNGARLLLREFEGFAFGTDIEDLWHWIEEECPEFSVGDAMNGKYNPKGT